MKQKTNKVDMEKKILIIRTTAMLSKLKMDLGEKKWAPELVIISKIIEGANKLVLDIKEVFPDTEIVVGDIITWEPR